MSEQKYKSMDDLVFENRNKEYGAYDLRMKENSTLLKAFLIGTITCMVIIGFALSYDAIFKKEKNTETAVVVNLQDVEQPEIIKDEPPPPPPPEEEPEPPKVETVKVVMPDPKPEPKKEETVPDIKDMKNALLGMENIKGEETNSIKSQPKVESPQGTGAPAAVGNFTARQVRDMAVYPGCEKFKGNKEKLIECFSQKLSTELNDQLSDFGEVLNDRGETKAIAKLQFVIDKSGRIIQVKPMKGSHADLGRESEKALERIASRLSSRGKLIEPAKLEDGSPVNLQFQIPVTFKTQ